MYTKENQNICLKTISNNLKTIFVGKSLYFYDTIDSTNRIAMDGGKSGSLNGSVYIACNQTHGRGRLNRTWLSLKNSISMSILLRPKLKIQNINKITLVSGVAICNILKKLKLSPSLKYPNDVLVNNKKICGILTQSRMTVDSNYYIVIGIGLNVNTTLFPSSIKNIATSVSVETNKTLNINTLICDLLFELERNYLKFLENGFASFSHEYSVLCKENPL